MIEKVYLKIHVAQTTIVIDGGVEFLHNWVRFSIETSSP